MGKLSTIKVKERSENLSQGFGLKCGVKVDGSTWFLVRISKTELAMDPCTWGFLVSKVFLMDESMHGGQTMGLTSVVAV